MSKTLLALLVLLANLSITGCLPRIKNFDNYQALNLERAEVFPSISQIETKTPSIVVLDIRNDDEAKGSHYTKLGTYMTRKIEETLLKEKFATLVSRDTNRKIVDEVKLAEASGKLTGNVGSDVNYAIAGEINSTSLTSKMVTTGTTSVGSIPISSQKGYEYTASASADLRIYSLPDMSVISTITIQGQKKSTEEAMVEKSSIISNKYAPPRQYDEAMMTEAINNGLQSALTQLRNLFAKKGYIIEAKKLDSKIIVKVNFGLKDGIKHGNKVKIIHKAVDVNPLTGRQSTDDIEIATGVVGDIISSNYAWVILDGQPDVKIGDIVSPHYTNSLLSKVIKQ